MIDDAEAIASPQAYDWETLLDRQREQEDAGTAQGAARFRERLASVNAAGASSAAGAAQRLLQGALGLVESALRDSIDNPRPASQWGLTRQASGKAKQSAGRTYPMCREWIQMVGPSVTAYLALKVALDATAGGEPATPTVLGKTLTTLMLDELRYRRFKAVAPKLFDYKFHTFSQHQTTHVGHMARSLKASMQFADIDCSDLDLDAGVRAVIGIQIMDLVAETTGWFRVERLAQHRGKKLLPKIVLVLCDEVRLALEATNDLLALQRPVTGPMVVPPLPWEPGGRRGGYRYALRGKFALVTRTSRAHEGMLDAANMPQVYTALNAVQETPWRINRRVLEVMQEIMDLGGGFAGVPVSTPLPLPEQPLDVDTNDVARKAWRGEAHAVHNAEHKRSAKADTLRRVVDVAESVCEYPAIYFPHHADFRGRLYPIATHLTPQGNDSTRSLLIFADGKPLGEAGAQWLAIHGANCLGKAPDGRKVSHMTLQERVDLIDSLADTILAIADDPVGAPGLFMNADKPFGFLAWCFEWADYLRSGRDEAFVSYLPVSFDGSCNGLQHFSALLLDDVGGRAVNLVPDERPQDIYQCVADTVLRSLQPDSSEDAARWLSLHARRPIVDRKLAKRPTMTVGSGSKRAGFRRQLVEYLGGLDDADEIGNHFATDGKPAWQATHLACRYMADRMWDALTGTVGSAFSAMSWMQSAARGITATGRPVSWVAPTGFPVRQPYHELRNVRVQTVLAGSAICPTFYRQTPKIDRRKQGAGLPPNVVHSLDASALVFTVNAMVEQGIEHFHVIHDCFGTHAGDAPVLSRAIRESFTKLYTDRDVLHDLWRQWRVQWDHPDKCPAPPAKGTLDLSGVLKSDFFFA